MTMEIMLTPMLFSVMFTSLTFFSPLFLFFVSLAFRKTKKPAKTLTQCYACGKWSPPK